jgi:hypothetical protein
MQRNNTQLLFNKNMSNNESNKMEVKKETQIDFSEIEDSNTEKIEYETLNEVDILVEKYFYFSEQLKRIRGRLYNLGIDPLKMNNLNNK